MLKRGRGRGEGKYGEEGGHEEEVGGGGGWEREGV